MLAANVKKQLEVRHGDVETLAEGLGAESVQTIITSPTYFKLRDYGMPRELGKEKSLQDYVERLVNIFHKLKPALRKDGTVWLNLGDTYEKTELMDVPWRVAFALKDDGWILRSDIIWHKPNAMPSPARNRPTTDHEYIFLFAKSKDYYYDADSIREPHVTFSANSKMRGGRNHLEKKVEHPRKVNFLVIRSYTAGIGTTCFTRKEETSARFGQSL